MRKLRAVKSERSKEGIRALSFGWRWGKKISWKIAPDKDTVFFCTSTTEWVPGCFGETEISCFFYFFSFDMPAEGLEDFHEGLLFQWGRQAPARLAADRTSSSSLAAHCSLSPPALLPLPAPLPPHGLRAPFLPCGQSVRLRRSFPRSSPRSITEEHQPFFQQNRIFQAMLPKTPTQPQQTRELCPKGRILDPVKTARRNEVRGWRDAEAVHQGGQDCRESLLKARCAPTPSTSAEGRWDRCLQMR